MPRRTSSSVFTKYNEWLYFTPVSPCGQEEEINFGTFSGLNPGTGSLSQDVSKLSDYVEDSKLSPTKNSDDLQDDHVRKDDPQGITDANWYSKTNDPCMFETRTRDLQDI